MKLSKIKSINIIIIISLILTSLSILKGSNVFYSALSLLLFSSGILITEYLFENIIKQKKKSLRVLLKVILPIITISWIVFFLVNIILYFTNGQLLSEINSNILNYLTFTNVFSKNIELFSPLTTYYFVEILIYSTLIIYLLILLLKKYLKNKNLLILLLFLLIIIIYVYNRFIDFDYYSYIYQFSFLSNIYILLLGSLLYLITTRINIKSSFTFSTIFLVIGMITFLVSNNDTSSYFIFGQLLSLIFISLFVIFSQSDTNIYYLIGNRFNNILINASTFILVLTAIYYSLIYQENIFDQTIVVSLIILSISVLVCIFIYFLITYSFIRNFKFRYVCLFISIALIFITTTLSSSINKYEELYEVEDRVDDYKLVTSELDYTTRNIVKTYDINNASSEFIDQQIVYISQRDIQFSIEDLIYVKTNEINNDMLKQYNNENSIVIIDVSDFALIDYDNLVNVFDTIDEMQVYLVTQNNDYNYSDKLTINYNRLEISKSNVNVVDWQGYVEESSYSNLENYNKLSYNGILEYKKLIYNEVK